MCEAAAARRFHSGTRPEGQNRRGRGCRGRGSAGGPCAGMRAARRTDDGTVRSTTGACTVTLPRGDGGSLAAGPWSPAAVTTSMPEAEAAQPGVIGTAVSSRWPSLVLPVPAPTPGAALGRISATGVPRQSLTVDPPATAAACSARRRDATTSPVPASAGPSAGSPSRQACSSDSGAPESVTARPGWGSPDPAVTDGAAGPSPRTPTTGPWGPGKSPQSSSVFPSSAA
mmetsp:Transcript_24154/g.91152  ORF Transcript_24154/g.91152 Transcript_24154/m.91152 type:complete len:228 (+) Transcript_24154:859-1542(+)